MSVGCWLVGSLLIGIKLDFDELTEAAKKKKNCDMARSIWEILDIFSLLL